MSGEMLIGLISQIATMLSRGQEFSEFPTPISHGIFYFVVSSVIIIHVAILIIRY